MKSRKIYVSVAAALGVALLAAAPAEAAVGLRVVAQPVSDPVQVFVQVTDGSGRPVSGLKASDFTVLVDGTAITSPTFSLPPSSDGTRRVSAVMAMDMSNSVRNAALEPMQQAVTTFIGAMNNGDYAAIVKFNETNPARASVVQPFTQIDGGAGNSALVSAVNAPYTGSGSNVLDGVLLSVNHIKSPPSALPAGPKAVLLVSDGRDNASTATRDTVISTANGAGTPVFAIGVGDLTASGIDLLQTLANGTGGSYISSPNTSQIDAAYTKIRDLLNNEYLLSFSSSITDCNSHNVEVRVTGQPNATSTFRRCTSSGGGGGGSGGGDSGGGGGGGGGALGLADLLVGGALALFARRRWTARRGTQPSA